jgi:glycosyltransferase involved in cell wall biosynthesis
MLRSAEIARVPARRLLIVSYAYPPMPTVGSNRWDAMARHLRELGHHVTVVSTAAFGEIPDVSQERHVRRAPDLMASPLLRRIMRRGRLPAPSHASAAEIAATPPSTPLPAALHSVLVPDIYLATWVPRATIAARRVLREEPIDCVITSSPYESTHLVGFSVRRRGPAWLADFRDGWCLEPHRPPFPTALQRAIDRALEARVARAADMLTAATQGIASDFASRVGVRAAYVPNGYDPLRHDKLPEFPLRGIPDDAIVIAHTGKLAGLRGRDPRPLFAAIRRLSAEDPRLGLRIRLVLAGRMDSEDARIVAECGLGEQLIEVGQCSHAESIALQRRADVLVLLTSIGRDVVTGKLCEYLSAERPILVLGDDTGAAEIVTETATGITVPRSDVGAVAAALRVLTGSDRGGVYAPRGVDRYVYPGPAEAMAELVEEAIVRRAGGRHATA